MNDFPVNDDHDKSDSSLPEAEIRRICDAVGLKVQAVEHAPGKTLLATISPVRTHPSMLVGKLYHAMKELETRWYAVSHQALFSDTYTELVFTPLDTASVRPNVEA